MELIKTEALSRDTLIDDCEQGHSETPLNEFTLLIRCSIVTDHYLFQCLKAILFGYVQAIGAGGLSMTIENFQRVRKSLSILGHRKIFQIEFIRQLEKAVLNLAFCK